jgi:DNA-binding XRE family transcriptional regulator
MDRDIMKNKQQFSYENWHGIILKIKQEAIAKNIQESQIAEFANISVSTVNRIFNLDFCPKLSIVIKMAKSVNINIYID